MMNSVLTLTNTLNLERQFDYLDLSVKELVQSASKVIVPLGPITTFAARNPWVGMEQQSFEQVAHHLKDICDVDIYPNDSMIKSAWNHGEINEEFLETGLRNWLDRQALKLPRDVAERYCRAALQGDKQSSEPLSLSELKNLAKKLSRFKPKMTEKHSVQTYS